MRRGGHALRKNESPYGEAAQLEDKLRQGLQSCVAFFQEGDGPGAPWGDLLTLACELEDPLDLAADEPGVVLAESLASHVSPSQVLPLFRHFSATTQDLILQQWRNLTAAIPLAPHPPEDDYEAAARAYIAFRAVELARCLEERFIEGGNSACSRGDLYLTRDDHYFYNFSYLCGEFGLVRDEAISALRALARNVEPQSEHLSRLGGSERFSALIAPLLELDGDTVPQALAELLPLVDLPFDQVTTHLHQTLISQITVTAVARRLGFTLEPHELLEIYEVDAVSSAVGEDRAALLDFLTSLYHFEPDPEHEVVCPSPAWQAHWKSFTSRYGEERVADWVMQLIPVYQAFSAMLGEQPFHRVAAGWQASCLNREEAANWVVLVTTERGVASPVVAASLLQAEMPPAALANLARAWRDEVVEVPQQSTWSREFTVLVLRYAITRQRCWLMDRLTDLYLRGGGYEAGETREIIETILESLLDEMRLSEEQLERLESSGLHFELLPSDINVFTGERVDASRWASPTSAYKYVRTLLRLEDRGLDYLASLVSERRVVALEKALRRLDFHTSVQQVVACVSAYEERPDFALDLLLALRTSSGERPSKEWLERTQVLLEHLGEEAACRLLWDLYRADNGDAYSLNPGIFWALRLVPTPQSVAQIAKAATEMVRRKPSYAIAALDTLDAISTRSALSAILQMRRRIRNRKVVKLINRTIDRIAKEDGLDRDVFLDYAVDTGDLERDSSRLFDFGSHQVTLRLEVDGRISTTVLDAKGRHLRSFPKTAKDADPLLYKEFQATKKLLVETISYQVRRLEQSMINRRAWQGKDFLEVFREHPVMSHLGKRLVWAKVVEAREVATFIPSGEAFVDAQGAPVEILEEDTVIILHPLFFEAADQAAWRERLAIMKIVQPFAQTEREIYHALAQEVDGGKILRLVGLRADSNDLYRVVKERGWSTDGGGPWEVGNATHSYRHYPTPDQTVHLDTDVLGYDRQLTILSLRFTCAESEIEVSAIDRVAYSEAFRDLLLCFDKVPAKAMLAV